jgi:DNA-binding transcriptional LysR family regulator
MLNEIDLSRADLNLLVLFETVMETLHVGRAAKQLNLSPSAVSHGLGRLRGLLDDPLFFRTPKGVAPTDRALHLAPEIADVLARVRSVVASAKPFDPAKSSRRFTIGAPDGAALVFVPPLLAQLRLSAPGIDISIRQLLPKPGELAPNPAWREVLSDLEARRVDVAVLPSADLPLRFAARTLYEEDFVVAMRARHPFAKAPTLGNYCKMDHLVVSETGDAHGFVDVALSRRRLRRHVVLTAPNFMFALAVIAETDLISAMPRRFVALHGPRFGVVSAEAPINLPGFKLTIVTPKVALKDTGLAWLVEALAQSTVGKAGPSRRRRRSG